MQNPSLKCRVQKKSFIKLTPGHTIKHFVSTIVPYQSKLEHLANVSHFHPSLIFAGPLHYTTLLHSQASSLARKHQTKVKETNSDKHTSLLQSVNNYDRKSFIAQAPVPQQSGPLLLDGLSVREEEDKHCGFYYNSPQT